MPPPETTSIPSHGHLLTAVTPPTLNTSTSGIQQNAEHKARSKPSFAAILQGHNPNPQSSPRTNKKTFASVFSTDEDVQVKQPVIHRGKLTLMFLDEEVSKLAAHYKFAMIGKFSRKSPEFKAIKPGLTKMGFRGDFTVGALRPGFVLLNFQLEEDYTRLWLKPEWQVAGWPMRVFKWTPSFTYEAESTLVAVWVAFPDLPVHLFSKSALYSIASMVGKPIKLDEPTADRTRPSIARVCVEIDLLKDYDQELWVSCGSHGSFPLKFFFENRPPYCQQCQKRGHDSTQCRFGLQPEQGKGKTIGLSERGFDQNGKETAGPSNRAEKQHQTQSLQKKGVFARLGPLGRRESIPGKGQKGLGDKDSLKTSGTGKEKPLAEKGNSRAEGLGEEEDSMEKEASSVICLNKFNQRHILTSPSNGKDIPAPLLLDKNHPIISVDQPRNKPAGEGILASINPFSILEQTVDELDRGSPAAVVRIQEEDEGILDPSTSTRDRLGKDKNSLTLVSQLKRTEEATLENTPAAKKKKKQSIVMVDPTDFDRGQNNFDRGQNNFDHGQNNFDQGQNKLVMKQSNLDLSQQPANVHKRLDGRILDSFTPHLAAGSSAGGKDNSDILMAPLSKDKNILQDQRNTSDSRDGKKVHRLLKFLEADENGKSAQGCQSSDPIDMQGEVQNRIQHTLRELHKGILNFDTMKVLLNEEVKEIPSNFQSPPEETSDQTSTASIQNRKLKSALTPTSHLVRRKIQNAKKEKSSVPSKNVNVTLRSTTKGSVDSPSSKGNL